MNFKVKVIYENNTYVLVAEARENLRISLTDIKEKCNVTKITGMGNTLYVLEMEADCLVKTFEEEVLHEVGENYYIKLNYNLEDRKSVV